MQQQPLDYESPTRNRTIALPRWLGRVVIGSWILFGIASALLVTNSDDRNPLQWPTAMMMVVTMALAAVMTFAYCVVQVVLWFSDHKPDAK